MYATRLVSAPLKRIPVTGLAARYFASASTTGPIDFRRVTSLDSPDFEGACATLPKSFGGDDVSVALNGNDNELAKARLRASITTALLDGEVYVASTSKGGPVEGAMLVKKPGVEHGASPNAKGSHTKVVDELTKDAKLKENAKKLDSVFNEVKTKAFGPNRVKDMYYISHIGVEPSEQGKGLASGLIRHIVDRAHGEGVPVSLLTMNGTTEAAFRHLGFTSHTVQEAEIGGTKTRWYAMKTDVPVPSSQSA